MSLEPNRKIVDLLEKVFDINQTQKYDWQDIFSCLDAYKDWLSNLVAPFKEKTDEYIAEQIFSKREQLSEKDCEYHLLALNKCIDEIYQELEQCKVHYSFDDKYAKGKLYLLRDIVLDSYEFISDYKKYILEEELDSSCGRRRKFSSNEIFFCSINLLRRHYYYNDITFSSIPIFLIRQSIETKTLNSLGIETIDDSQGKAAKFKLEKLIEFICLREKIQFPIKKSILLKIYHWTNAYIHMGIMPYHWNTVWAHKMLDPLFSGGKNGGTCSIYGAVKINKQYYQQDFETELLTFLGLSESDYTIIKLSRPEALLI